LLELPKKELLRVDEVAMYFSVSDRCVRLWIDHGHLVAEKIVGSIRVTRDSVLKCRFANQQVPPPSNKETDWQEPDADKTPIKRGRPSSNGKMTKV